VHLGAFLPPQLRFRHRQRNCREFNVALIGRELWPPLGKGHAVFEFGGRAPDSPPARLRLQQIAQRMPRLLGLQPLRIANCFVEIERIDFVERCLGPERQNKFFRANFARIKRNPQNQNEATQNCRSQQPAHGVHTNSGR
jgi:hypothetical protein